MIGKSTNDARPGDSSGSPVPGSLSRLQKSARWLWGKIRRGLGNRYFIFLVFMMALSEALSKLSGLSPIRSHFLTEAPLLLLLYWALNFALRPGKIAPYVAAFPFIVVYTGYDIVFLAYGDVFRVIDFRNLPELLKVLPLVKNIGFVLVLALPVILLLYFADYRRYRRVLTIAGLAILVISAVEFFPGAVVAGLDWVGLSPTEHSDAQSVNENGRFSMTLYFEARRRKAVADTALYRDRVDYPMQARAAVDFIRGRGNRRNVHLVVLESFVDPTLFAAVSYSKDPRHPDFAKLVGNGQGFSVSPVFGGQTAQAEFEVLCGVPALHRLSTIEFNDFTGDAAGCMPGILAQAGYSTTVSNSFEPDYFNSTKAYTGIGFQNIYFPVEYAKSRATYLTMGEWSDDEEYLFDGDLFDQNLAFVAKTLQENPDRPILNYLLGMYGHEPHKLDRNKRPLVLSMKSAHTDEQLLRAANQYWYRTQAIARFVRGLIKLDPQSLIIIVSDHLPPLDDGVKSYKNFRYLDNIEDSTHLNRILVVENGKVVRHKTIHHYDVPSLIYNYLTGGEFCTKLDCVLSSSARQERYMSVMARAVGVR